MILFRVSTYFRPKKFKSGHDHDFLKRTILKGAREDLNGRWSGLQDGWGELEKERWRQRKAPYGPAAQKEEEGKGD